MNIPFKKMKSTRVVLHCTATKDYFKNRDEDKKDFDYHFNIGFSEVDAWHKSFGWRGFGYHFLVKRNGTLVKGRKVGTKGAHAKGKFEGLNGNNQIGVAYVGSKRPTREQEDTLVKLAHKLHIEYGISWWDWRGHYQYKNTDCPGFGVEDVKNLASGEPFHGKWKKVNGDYEKL